MTILIKSSAHAEQGPRERQEDATLYDPASRTWDELEPYRTRNPIESLMALANANKEKP